MDETGGQIAIVGRIGARPFTRKEMEKMYLNPKGELWTVTDRGQSGDYVPRRNPQNLASPNVASNASNRRDKQP